MASRQPDWASRGFLVNPRISPDGKRVAVQVFDIQSGTTDIWFKEPARNANTRFTFDPAFDNSPVWSPDGSHIAFCSDRKARMNYDIYQKDSSGARNEEVLLESSEIKYPTSWSSDGRFIAYTSRAMLPDKGQIWVLPLFGERKPFPFLQTRFDEAHAQFSPDGHLIAYDSDESGSRQVYVASFPGPGGKRQVSTGGGEDPIWRRDGKEIYFLSEGKLMAAEVKSNGSSLDLGNAQLLFDAHTGFGPWAHYDVSPDGKRFLVSSSTEGTYAPMTLVVNWTADMKR
jgi:Tol biopolymer transport system component